MWEKTKAARDKVLTLHKVQARKLQNKSLTLPNPASFMLQQTSDGSWPLSELQFALGNIFTHSTLTKCVTMDKSLLSGLASTSETQEG